MCRFLLTLQHLFALGLILSLPLTAHARIQQWKILPNEGELVFIDSQSGAPLMGRFSNFTGDMYFDPERLAESNVRLIINLAAMPDPTNQFSQSLQATDWFNTKIMPEAVFQSTHFVYTGFQTYQVDGLLTLRDKIVPMTVSILLDHASPTRARLAGSATIRRAAFGASQRGWSSADVVKNDVLVKLIVNATREQTSNRDINANEVWLK
jgi:polyisoprenoid-binding protein YceI